MTEPSYARSIEFSLRPTWRAAIFLLALGAVGVIVGGEATRLWISEALWSTFTVPNLERALTIDPVDPRIHRILGSHYCYSEVPDMAKGLMHLRRATELCPYGASYWYSLGSACDLIIDVACGDEAFARTLHLSPEVPKFQWAAANHFLVTDRTDEALSYFHHLLEIEPGYAWPTFRLCLRATRDPQLVFQKVVGNDSDIKVKLNYVNFLSGEGDNLDAARQIWSQTMAAPSPFPLPTAEPYVERLVNLGRGEDVKTAWQDLEHAGVVPPADAGDSENLIYNGGFEHPALNTGLDWRSSNQPYMTVDYSDPGAHQGSRSLRLDFTVSRNEDFLGTYQFVPVEPNQKYVLQAFLRTENITSDSGPRLQVVDPVCQTCVNVVGDSSVGTTPWHQEALKFTTAPNTHMIQVVVIRLRGRSFPNEITGSCWVDDISLKVDHSDAGDATLKAAH